MPATTTTRQRNDRIRAAGDQIRRDRPWRSQQQIASQLVDEFGLSQITIANILRGRDLNPPPSAQNRRTRRASGAPAAGQRLGLNRRFGVEIEFNGCSRWSVQAQIDAGAFGRGWRVKSDCSVRGEGLELVSPPLSGEAGLDSVRQACSVLRGLGAQVDSSCGLHVHHEARDLGALGIARVARLWQRHNHLTQWLIAPSRRNNSYCPPLSESDVTSIERNASRGSVGGVGRYRDLNVSAFLAHGTIEIRSHQGTLNFRKIEAWIHLGQGFMDAAVECRQVSATGLRNLLQAVVADEDAQAFLLGRGMQFGVPTNQMVAVAA
jgi:hypothetical protein